MDPIGGLAEANRLLEGQFVIDTLYTEGERFHTIVGGEVAERDGSRGRFEQGGIVAFGDGALIKTADFEAYVLTHIERATP